MLRTSRNGFTLIEIIVVTMIIVVILGISLAKYNEFAEQKKLDRDIDGLIDVLEMAKTKDMAGDQAGISCTEFNGYSVAISGNSYTLNFCCADDCTTNKLKNYSLSGTNSVIAAKNIRFLPLTGAQLGGVGDQTITLKNKLINKCMDITVTQDGVIVRGENQYDGC